MEYTQNYKLKKPGQEDFYNVEDFNENADIIDQKLKEIEDKTQNIEVPVTSVNGKTGDVELSAEDVGAETPAGAQEKANQAEANAKAYTDQEVSIVANDLASHKADYATLDKAGHVKAKTDADGKLILDIPKSNYNADREPNVNDDESQGYSVGSTWLFKEQGVFVHYYVCVDASIGKSRWIKLFRGIGQGEGFYIEGEEVVAWEKYGEGTHGTRSFYKRDDHIFARVNSTSGTDSYLSYVTFGSSDPINLSNLDRIIVEWENTGTENRNFSRIAVIPASRGKESRIDIGSYVSAVTVKSGPFDRRLDIVDVSALQGDYYIGVQAYATYAYPERTGGTSELKVYQILGG